MDVLTVIGFWIGAYLLASVSSAIFICRIYGLPDPRQAGSHNPGTTNVLRLGGKVPAVLTLVGDLFKGWFPVLLTHYFIGKDWISAITILLSCLGHIYPVYYRFKGGKGVATALGGLFALSPLLGVAVVGTWIVIAALFRYSSLAALVALTLCPLYAFGFLGVQVVGPLLLLTLLIIYKHKDNIKRLVLGKESKLSFFSKS